MSDQIKSENAVIVKKFCKRILFGNLITFGIGFIGIGYGYIGLWFTLECLPRFPNNRLFGLLSTETGRNIYWMILTGVTYGILGSFIGSRVREIKLKFYDK